MLRWVSWTSYRRMPGHNGTNPPFPARSNVNAIVRNQASAQRSAGGTAEVTALARWQLGVAGEWIGRRLDHERRAEKW
jgi:hypothetical protein